MAFSPTSIPAERIFSNELVLKMYAVHIFPIPQSDQSSTATAMKAPFSMTPAPPAELSSPFCLIRVKPYESAENSYAPTFCVVTVLL